MLHTIKACYVRSMRSSYSPLLLSRFRLFSYTKSTYPTAGSYSRLSVSCIPARVPAEFDEVPPRVACYPPLCFLASVRQTMCGILMSCSDKNKVSDKCPVRALRLDFMTYIYVATCVTILHLKKNRLCRSSLR